MAMNAEFLNGILSNEETSVEDKVKLIVAEHDADVRGLVSKKEELLAQEVKLKEKIKDYEANVSESATRLANMEEELKKNSPEETKKFFENQLNLKEKDWLAEKEQLIAERDNYKASHLKRLEADAIAEGTKDLKFLDGLKDGFVARVMSMNKFEPKEIDGQICFLTSDMKTVGDVMQAFAITDEGKAYIKNSASGGGASTTVNTGTTSSGESNPFKAETFNLTKQMELYKTNPTLAKRLMEQAKVN